MLSTMRKNLKSLSWTLWLVILTFIGFIFIEWGAGRLNPFGGESDLLSINGEIVKTDEFTQNLFQSLEIYKMQFGDNFNTSIINQLRIPEQILQSVVHKTIILQEAKKFHINASDEELKNKIINIPGFQRDGQFIGIKEYERFLAYKRVKISEFESDLKKDVIVDKFKELVSGGIVIDNSTLWELYQKEKDTAELEFLTLGLDRIKQNIDTEENILKSFYNQNKTVFKSPEKRSGRVIALKYDDYKKEIKITNQELFDYFKKYKNLFFIPEKIKISRIFLKYEKENRDQILKNAESLFESLTAANFTENARAVSQDEKAQNGGDWGYSEWKNFSKPELDTIKNMKENRISNPIDTSDGFSIILISEKINQKQETFDETKDRIKDIIQREKLYSFVKEKLNSIHKKLDSEQDMRKKAREMEIKVLETEFLTEGESIEGLDETGNISRTFFGLNKNQIEFPVELRKGLAIVQLAEKKLPAVEDFKNIKEQVKEKYINLKKVELLIQEGNTVLDALKGMKDQKSLSEFLKKSNLGFANVSYKRGNKLSHFPIKNNLDEIIFSLSENQYSSPIQFDSDVVIVKMKSKKKTDQKDFEDNKTAFYQKQIEEMKNIYFGQYIMKKREKSEIKFNEEIFKKIKDYVISRF